MIPGDAIVFKEGTSRSETPARPARSGARESDTLRPRCYTKIMSSGVSAVRVGHRHGLRDGLSPGRCTKSLPGAVATTACEWAPDADLSAFLRHLSIVNRHRLDNVESHGTTRMTR